MRLRKKDDIKGSWSFSVSKLSEKAQCKTFRLMCGIDCGGRETSGEKKKKNTKYEPEVDG